MPTDKPTLESRGIFTLQDLIKRLERNGDGTERRVRFNCPGRPDMGVLSIYIGEDGFIDVDVGYDGE